MQFNWKWIFDIFKLLWRQVYLYFIQSRGFESRHAYVLMSDLHRQFKGYAVWHSNHCESDSQVTFQWHFTFAMLPWDLSAFTFKRGPQSWRLSLLQCSLETWLSPAPPWDLVNQDGFHLFSWDFELNSFHPQTRAPLGTLSIMTAFTLGLWTE